MTVPAKIVMSDSQQYYWNLYPINNVEDIEVFLGLIVFFCNRKSLFRETTIENNQFSLL